jgi:glutamate carboxypeptidase
MTYFAYLMDHQEDMTAMLRTAVGYETPSCEKAAIDRFTHYLGEVFRRIGAAVEVLEQADAGNHMRATWGEGTNQALILCHMDTVWPSGEIHRRPFRIENGKAYGGDCSGDFCPAGHCRFKKEDSAKNCFSP